MKQVLNNSINGVVIVENSDDILYMNKKAREILGIQGKRNEKSNEILKKDDLSKLQNLDIEGFHKIHYNNRILVASTLSIIDEENIKRRAYILQDISKYEAAVEEISKYKELTYTLEAIINSSYDGIYVTDGEANTLIVNGAYERITGIKASEVLGKNMKDLEKNGVLNQSSSILAIENRKPITIRQVIRRDKEILVTSTPVFSSNGDITYVVTNVRDISNLVNLKNELIDTKALNERYLTELQHIKNKLVNTPEIIIKDSNMLKVMEMAMRVAKVDTTVLLSGETGVGKGQLADFIHKNSLRAKENYIEINCGAIPENLIESELFGYEKGAFTGANKQGKMGMFELASKGTLLLDEVSELSLELQVKLLKALEEKKIYRIGGEKPIPINSRIIAASNKDLKQMVEKGSFRDDLYYRLNVVPIHIFPLRERRDEIIPLCLKFLEDFNKKYAMNKFFAPITLNKLLYYNWPGNVRELKNLVERMVVIAPEDELTEELLPEYIFNNHFSKENLSHTEIGKDLQCSDMSLKEATYEFEKSYIRNAIKKYGSLKKAAKNLNIDPSTINRKLKR